MDTRLLDILVCPICKGPLDYDKKAQELICRPDRLAYPIRDGIPIMWAEDARDLNAASVSSAPSMPFPTEPEPEKAAPASPPAGKPLPPARQVTDAPSTGSTTSDIPSGGGE